MHVASYPMDNAQHAFQQLQGFQGCGMMGESVPMSESNLSFGQRSWQGEGTNWCDPSLAHLTPKGQAELGPSQPTSWKELKCEEVDEDFERDVTHAVAMFLQGNDMDMDSEEDGELDDLAKSQTPTRAPGPVNTPPGDEELEKVNRDPQLLSQICQFAKRLQQLGHPDSHMPPEMPEGNWLHGASAS